MCVVVRAGAHILLAHAAGGGNHIGVRPNLHLDSAGVLLQKVVKNRLLKKARIIAAFNVNGVDFQEATGAVAAQFHFDFCRVDKITFPFSA